MKILFLSDNFPPESNAPATRTYEHCVEWIKLGASVTVITCFPNFPRGKIYDGYKNTIVKRENIAGINVIRVWSFIAANQGVIRRTLDFFSFAITSFFAGLFIKADIIVATSPQFFTTWSGYALSFFKRLPWVFELRDIWPESITAVGAIKMNFALRLLKKIELGLYRNSSKVIALTWAFKQNLVARGINENKIDVIPNGSNLELFYPREKSVELLEKYNLNGKFVVGYIGTHGMAHGLDFIIRSISKIKNKNIIFLFVGDGAMKDSIVKLAGELNLQNVIFIDPVKKEDVPIYMSTLDVALVSLKAQSLFELVIPSKIFEAAAMDKPVILGVLGQAKEIVDKAQIGLCYEPENEIDFIKKITMISSDKRLYNVLKENCQNLASQYNRKYLAKKMLQSLEESIVQHQKK